jgi:uncharacterized protein
VIGNQTVTVTDRSPTGKGGRDRFRKAEFARRAYDAAMTDSAPAATELVVEDNAEESRYEAWLGDRIVGIAEYELADEAGPIVFTHTEVLPGAEGMGVGRGLARGALDDVRRRGLRLVAECEFIAGYLKRHPEDRDLIAG